MDTKYTLVSFVSSWGSKFGGINAFNTNFLSSIAKKYKKVNVICVALSASDKDILEARKKDVILYAKSSKAAIDDFDRPTVELIVEDLLSSKIVSNTRNVVWLGHDRITGIAAIFAKDIAGGRSAVINHMSYDHYESFAENSEVAKAMVKYQSEIFKQADLLLAVGPLLKSALHNLVDVSEEEICEIIPGLDVDRIKPRKNFLTDQFSLFISGRFDSNAIKVKQGQLAIAAFCDFLKQEKNRGIDSIDSKILVRGVNFDLSDSETISRSENDLKEFAEQYAQQAVNIQALPFTTNLEDLASELTASKVAIMPSWHEGFGLVAWEAIAAGVPLIVTKNSGVYKALKRLHLENLVWPVDVKATHSYPYFRSEDVDTVRTQINIIHSNLSAAREKALKLLAELEKDYTWSNCAESVFRHFGWQVSDSITVSITQKPPLNPLKPRDIQYIDLFDDDLYDTNLIYTANQPSNYIDHFNSIRYQIFLAILFNRVIVVPEQWAVSSATFVKVFGEVLTGFENHGTISKPESGGKPNALQVELPLAISFIDRNVDSISAYYAAFISRLSRENGDRMIQLSPMLSSGSSESAHARIDLANYFKELVNTNRGHVDDWHKHIDRMNKSIDNLEVATNASQLMSYVQKYPQVIRLHSERSYREKLSQNVAFVEQAVLQLHQQDTQDDLLTEFKGFFGEVRNKSIPFDMIMEMQKSLFINDRGERNYSNGSSALIKKMGRFVMHDAMARNMNTNYVASMGNSFDPMNNFITQGANHDKIIVNKIRKNEEQIQTKSDVSLWVMKSPQGTLSKGKLFWPAIWQTVWAFSVSDQWRSLRRDLEKKLSTIPEDQRYDKSLWSEMFDMINDASIFFHIASSKRNPKDFILSMPISRNGEHLYDWPDEPNITEFNAELSLLFKDIMRSEKDSFEYATDNEGYKGLDYNTK